MSVTPAKLADLPYIVNLSRRHAEELGFLTRSAMEAYLTRGRVAIARENGDPCGYFLTGGLSRHVRIFQACVQLDARGLAHGIGLLSELITRAAHAGTQQISLHCRDGLASNGFWTACGFSSSGLLLGGSARRKIVHTWNLQISAALALPSLPYARHFFASLRAGPQEGARPPASCSLQGASTCWHQGASRPPTFQPAAATHAG